MTTFTTSTHEARAIAREAYLYAHPVVQNSLSIFQFAIDTGGGQYKGPMNAVQNVALDGRWQGPPIQTAGKA